MKALVAYIPVLHAGYNAFVARHPDAVCIHLITTEDIASLGPMYEYITRKDQLRAVPLFQIQAALTTSHRTFVSRGDLRHASIREVVLPDEDVSRAFAARYISGCKVTFDPVFLRYDRSRVQAKEDAASLAIDELPVGQLERRLLRQAEEEALRSFDWWRQVGAVLVARDEDETVLIARNRHQPHEQWPYVYGDPRALFKGGEHIDVTTAQHAESALVGEAARRGLRTQDAELFITTFPCAPCMMHIGSAGVKRIFFIEGSYGLNSKEVLDHYGIEAIRVVPE